MSDTNMNNGITKVYASQDWVREQIDPFVANITQSYVAGTGFVYSCDIPHADLLAAHNAGRKIKFGVNGSLGNFVDYSVSTDDVIHIQYMVQRSLCHFRLTSDNELIRDFGADVVTKDMLAQETGAGPYIVMSQKATTDAINAVGDLVGDSSVSSQISTAITAKADLANGQYYVTASTSDGAAYTATVPGITALTAGISFIMIPAAVSTTKGPTLNVNGLGAKYIRRRLSSGATVDEGYTTTWLTKNKPFRVMYDGAQWIVEGHNKPVAADIYGTITATNDSDGNKIVDTYVTKTDWQNALPKSTSISILAASWTGSTNPWSQVVTVNGVTANSKVDLQPTATQIIDLQNNGVALMTENNSGVITVYALGNKPTSDYTMQVLITETISV